MPQDRAQRPEGGAPSASLPDVRATGGTYFLGRYRVVDEIGIGGMASVHLARMDGPGGFQKWVAIKRIHPHLVEDDAFVQMFLDEARVAASISHPNVAAVFDLGKHEDTYWIAMEYLHGEPLREVMRRTEELGTAMPPEIACRVIADAAEGLHAAHELLGKNGEKLGLVHRDVTPHNLFLTYDGVTRVVDFGIAKFASRMSHTRAGTLKGKLAYMSPEQVHGEGIDRRTDIFALGVVLWELTTGQRLFRMENDLDTLAKVQECNVPRPSTIIRGYPVDLEKIVMKALAKNRGERFRTAREFSRALQSLLMRRGLFIASDEVAAYMASVFQDRIQKREAHLRWAAEVTQTINVDQLLSAPKVASEFTSSDVQAAGPGGAPAGAPPVVRPAAGVPPPPLTNTGNIPTSQEFRPPVPDDLLETGQSLATQARAAGVAPPRPGGPPRPGPSPASRQAPPPPPEEHPADADGPTIQALPLAEMGRDPMPSEPPTMMEGKAPTFGSSPQGAELLEPDDDDFDEDQDATMVAATRVEANALHQPPTFPSDGSPSVKPSPAPAPPRPQPNRLASTAQIPPPAPMAFPATTSEVPFADAPLPMMGQPTIPPQRQPAPPTFSGEYPHSGHPSMPNVYPRSPQASSGRNYPTVTGPSNDGRTMTVERLRRRPPMWVVGALSCSIALLVAGIGIAIYSATSAPPKRAQPTPSTTGTGVAVAPPLGSGPFSSARTAFTAVAGPANAPPVPAPPPGAGAPVVPPALTAPPVTPPTPPVIDTPPTPPAPVETAPTATTAAPTAAAPQTQPQPAPRPQPAPIPTPVAPPKTPPKAGGLGAITVVCIPKCSQIIDNGTSLGAGHLFNRPVPAGRHNLTLVAPNGVRKNVVAEVVPEQTKEVRISMDR